MKRKGFQNRLLKIFYYFIAFALMVIVLNFTERGQYLRRNYCYFFSSFSGVHCFVEPSPPPLSGSDKGSLLWEFALWTDLQEDRGQEIGTIFEARDADGHLLMACGANNSSQTRRSVGNRMVEFFTASSDSIFITDCGQTSKATTRTAIVEERGHPVDLTAGTVLGADGFWKKASSSNAQKCWLVCNLHSVMGDSLYTLRDSFRDLTLWSYRGKQVCELPGDVHASLYYENKLYTITRSPSGIKTLYVSQWSPGTKKALTLNRFPIPVPDGEDIDIYGILGWKGRVLMVGGRSSLFEVDEKGIHTLYQTDAGELYTLLAWNDSVLIGHYPSGNLFRFDGEKVEPFNSPPLVSGAYGTVGGENPMFYREAQSLALYGGDLFVGMYPWGRLWRLNTEEGRWYDDRLFSSPNFTYDRSPYWPEIMRAIEKCTTEKEKEGRFEEMWGQRITALVPMQNSLYVGLGNRSGCPWSSTRDAFLGETWREYGSVRRLKRKGVLSSPLKWGSEKSKLTFRVYEHALELFQDDVLIGYSAAELNQKFISSIATLNFGKGLYGPSQLYINEG